MEASTPDKAEVLAITATMGWDDVDITVGKLFRVWRWFDQQTVNGNAPGVTSALLDRVAGVSGFAEAMQKVGWLTIKSSGITLPNFDRHNGKTAKARALTARRVNDFKKGTAESNAKVTQSALPVPLPREEKRREEVESKSKDSSASPQPNTKQKRDRKAPVATAMAAVEAFALDDSHRIWAAQNTPNVPPDVELEAWKDRLRANEYRTNQGPVRDPAASWRTAMRNAEKWGSYVKGHRNGNGNGAADGRRDAGGGATEARLAESRARIATWGEHEIIDLREKPD